jgi:hypothetical protein
MAEGMAAMVGASAAMAGQCAAPCTVGSKPDLDTAEPDMVRTMLGLDS